MKDTIYRQAAIDELVKWTHLNWEDLKTIYPMLNVFEKLPSAERHGRWLYDEYGWECSECGYPRARSQGKSAYCPNCGAKMDEVE